MKRYRIAFVGIGSIGKRHLRNLATYLNGKGDAFDIDLYRSGHGSELPEDITPLVNHVYPYSDDVVKDYDIVFITNPTISHFEALKKFRRHAKSFFIEKPIFDTIDVDMSIFDDLKDANCYVACPLRQHPVVSYVKNNINPEDVISVRAISSSYLPEWRPGTDYRKCFAAHRGMGGGVGIDLIHEWDYLIDIFGMPQVCYNIQDKVSNLEIDSDDIALYIAKTRSTTIELHLDYFGRQTIRTLDLFTKNDTIHCDLLAGTVSYLKEGKTITMDVVRDAYQIAELEHFFSIINNEIENDNTMERAFQVLKIAKGQI